MSYIPPAVHLPMLSKEAANGVEALEVGYIYYHYISHSNLSVLLPVCAISKDNATSGYMMADPIYTADPLNSAGEGTMLKINCLYKKLIVSPCFVKVDAEAHFTSLERENYEKFFGSQVISHRNLKLGECIGQGKLAVIIKL